MNGAESSKTSTLAQMFDLSGRTAMVTGAGSGLGRCFAVALALAGADVLCVDREAAANEDTVREISSIGRRSWGILGDVSQSCSVDEFIRAAGSVVSSIDILVNNAGIATPAVRTHELSEADWDRLVSINLKGVFLCSRVVVPMMLAVGKGTIINISSLLGLRGHYPGVACTAANYSASKAGVVGLTLQMAAEYAGDNIRVNAIAPGWHAGTNLGRERRASSNPSALEIFESSIVNRTPMRRKGRSEELAGLCVYLASDASSFVTGQIFSHDGGWTAT